MNFLYLADTRRYFSDETLAGLPAAIFAVLGEVTPQQLFAQCLAIHGQLVEPVSNHFGAPAQLTIGWVSVQGDPFFEVSEDTLRGWLRAGIDRPDLKLHAWLTLPSHEILDLTLPTTVSILYKKPENAGGILTKHPTDLTGGVAYHPMLVGEEFLWRIGAFRISMDRASPGLSALRASP